VVAILAFVLGLVVAFGGIAAARPDGWTRVTVLDVGQGDAILVTGSSGGRVLVDGGPDPDRLRALLDARIPAWDRRLDVVILTHPHEDHAAGLVGLLGRYRIDRFYEAGMAGPGPGYVALAGILDREGAPRGRLVTGDRLRVDDGRFRVLWPDAGSVPETPPDTGTGINNVSIVLELQVGRRSFLLTGDIEQDIDPILAGRGLPRVDVLKVAHHGSRTATTGPFLAAVKPAVAVVSAGVKNRYGHPAPSTIARLEATGSRVLRTDRDGTVTMATDGTALIVQPERESAHEAGATGNAEGHAEMPAAEVAWALGGLVYDRPDGRPGARRGRLPPARARSTGVAAATLGGGRRGRRIPRVPDRCPRGAYRSGARRGGRAPP
jgi:competence protein ComEC